MNYQAWTNRNYFDATEQMLQDTNLYQKDKITKKKSLIR